MLEFSTARIIVMPAYDFHERMLFADQISGLQRAADGPQAPLLVFTSPRSVEFGLGQVPPDVLAGAQVAAIGPSTARLLEASGICVNIRPQRGYTSEDLLESLSRQEKANGRQPRPAFILTAPGGRTTMKADQQNFCPRPWRPSKTRQPFWPYGPVPIRCMPCRNDYPHHAGRDCAGRTGWLFLNACSAWPGRTSPHTSTWPQDRRMPISLQR